jgi:hypothetical protein
MIGRPLKTALLTDTVEKVESNATVKISLNSAWGELWQ